MALLHTASRILRHRWRDSPSVSRLLSSATLKRLGERVAASEAAHTGEIRIAVEAGLPLSYLRRHAPARERAITLFGKLRVWDTEDNNGVLIYLLLAERAIEIVADRAISRVLPADFWPQTLAQLRPYLRQGDYETALALAIDATGAALAQHFPLSPGKTRSNALPDQPVLL
jgi:uncharacterized membrane protein